MEAAAVAAAGASAAAREEYSLDFRYSTAVAMFSAVSTAEEPEGWIIRSVLPTAGRIVAAKESGWNTFLIQSQL